MRVRSVADCRSEAREAAAREKSRQEEKGPSPTREGTDPGGGSGTKSRLQEHSSRSSYLGQREGEGKKTAGAKLEKQYLRTVTKIGRVDCRSTAREAVT